MNEMCMQKSLYHQAKVGRNFSTARKINKNALLELTEDSPYLFGNSKQPDNL